MTTTIETGRPGEAPWAAAEAPALCADRYALADPGLGPIVLGVDCYLRAIAGAVRDGEVVELPHLGRLRRLDLGRGVVFEAAPGLLEVGDAR